MTSTIYPTSSYGATIYVSGQKPTLDYDRLQLFSSLTQSGTVPFYVRWQYSTKYYVTGGSPTAPVYGGFAPLDEALDKINGTPGLRMILNVAYFPSWWLKIDASGNLLTYGDANAVLPDGPAMATVCTKLAQRYSSLIYSPTHNPNGCLILQICNEELDTGLNGKLGTVGGTIGAHLFNYGAQAIRNVVSGAFVVMGSVRPLSHPNGGQGTQLWMNNFWNYKVNTYYNNEPPQAIPDAHDFHYYRDSATITSNKSFVAPDPATTDNSDTATNAVVPNVAQVVSIMQGVISANGKTVPIWNLENGFNVPNNSPNNHNNSPTDTVSQQDRYTLSMMSQLWNAGATQYDFYTALTGGNDPRSLTNTAFTDLNTFISTNPQWSGSAPTQYLYTSVDTLDFWGTTATAPNDQYFAIMNPTTSSKTWSISTGGTAWLTAVTLPTNGISGTKNANLTSGTLAAGQCITLKCSADSTNPSLTSSTLATATLAVTVGAHTQNITVNLFTANKNAVPNLTTGTTSLNFNMNAGASAPATQTFTFKNADSFSTNWSVFTTGHWLSCATGGGATSGTLAAGASQTLTVTLNSNVSQFAPSLQNNPYTEVITVCATPHPTPYTAGTTGPTPFITITVNLTVKATSAANVQVSASALQFQAVASGSLPASQTFYLLNCSTGAQTGGTVTAGTYAGGGTGWLTLTPSSGINLPKNGTSTGTKPNIQYTDYQVVTVSANTTALVAGSHTAVITVNLGGATQTIPVTYVITSTGSTMTLGASPTSATLSASAGGASTSTTTTLTNSGNTNGNYSSAITYNQIQAGWLSVSPGNGAINGSGGTASITFTCTPGTLAAGTYTASVLFSPSIGSSTATVNITFTVTSGTASLSVFPPSLTFNDIVGAGSAAQQTITLTNKGSASSTWGATITYAANSGSGWIGLSISQDTLAAGASEQIAVSMIDSSLKLGTYNATITFKAGSSSVSVAVSLVINPVVTSSSSQMTSLDMAAQYQRIMSTIVGPQLSILAFTYYGGATNTQVILGELDALFPYEQMSQLHVMKSINDVTAFLNAYAYVANVLSDSPIVYYRLGESSNIYAYDISGRNMTGLISNTGGVITGVTQGQKGALTNSTDTAYLFDGSSGNVVLPAGVNTANWSGLTAECWLKLSNTTFSQTAFIIANDAPLTTNLGFNLAVTKNSVIFRIGHSSGYYEINQTYTFSANTWYHLVGVFSGTSLTAYVNGSQIATVSVTSALIAQTTNQVNIASKPNSTANNFPGVLDEISLYNTGLSATRVQAHYLGRLDATSQTSYYNLILADIPQAYYRMNESSGLVANDSSGNGFNATLSGSIVYGVAGILSTDTALNFDAYGGLTMPSSLNIGSWSAMSLEYWINITSGWQHIVITVDSSGNTLYYLNGAAYSSGSGDSVVVDQDVYYSGSFSSGSLDEIAIYNYVLSPSQVANHFQIGSLGV